MTDPSATDVTYVPASVESRWQEYWASHRTNAADITGAAHPYFNLMMFPYPSAEGLHVGNVFAFVGSDIHGRARRLQGYDVFEPLGFDAFGIHSENFALKQNIHPGELIPRNIERFRTQLKRIGLMVDWDHEVATTDPRYYRWTQWIFLQLFKAGIAVRKQAAVNWCPECKTVLANEQVVDGDCERHPGVAVVQRSLEQWFFKITDYAERLLDNLPTLDWSDSTRAMQTNWIGRSEGADLRFITDDGHEVVVYTTRPDTVFGATYVVLSPEHPLVDAVTTSAQRGVVDAYRAEATGRDIVSRKVGDKQKTGVFTGGYARNPATGDRIPVWVADYVLMEYGTGAIMAVPAHDDRDFEFATVFDLPIVQVVHGTDAEGNSLALPFSLTDGRLVNSGEFTDMPCHDAIPAVTDWLAERGLATRRTQYRLHDWCISRQRYWGPPIPIIHCDACGPVAVPEDDLPVELPNIPDFRPDESGVSPLARHADWYRVPCPTCGAEARRETDVSDTFLDSAWYFIRYPSTDFDDRPFDADVTRRWLPVAQYIGGNEHAVLHLLYSRFVTMVLKDLRHVDFEEPYVRFRAHGTIVRDGAKMSKSRGNVVNPDEYIAQWGADTFRMYLMSLGPYQEGGDFRDRGIVGIRRFLDKVWHLARTASPDVEPGPAVVQKLHQTIQKVTEDIDALRYNTAIASLMTYVNTVRAALPDGDRPSSSAVHPLVIMLAPFAPHFGEETWEALGGQPSVFDAEWPSFDAELAREDDVELVAQVNGKVRARLAVPRGLPRDEAVSRVLAHETIERFVADKTIRKTIHVPDRLVNLVVS